MPRFRPRPADPTVAGSAPGETTEPTFLFFGTFPILVSIHILMQERRQAHENKGLWSPDRPFDADGWRSNITDMPLTHYQLPTPPLFWAMYFRVLLA
jgi:hypothetical protein